MRSPQLLLPLIASLALSCSGSLRSQPPPATWTTSFWLWNHSRGEDELTGAQTSGKVDAIFVQTGTINKQTGRYAKEPWTVYAQLPEHLPAAREYWAVFRYEHQQVPDLAAAPLVAARISELRETARQRHLNLAGVQLDIDSPTGSLSQYVKFLAELRRRLPQGMELSITALLDWFRDGTSVGDVIKEVDEFVPQFYDLGDRQRGAIAAKIDAAKWGPVFNRFRKRFRIGVSTFGRARLVPATTPQGPYSGLASFYDVTPLDVATNSAFTLQTSRNEANELILNYRAARSVRLGPYNRFEAGDTVQFIIATPDTVRAAVENAKRMGDYCAGVVFFRWPTADEILVMQPGEVMQAAGVAAAEPGPPSAIQVVDGGCVAVHCVDLHLLNTVILSPTAVRYRIRSSAEMEYFLPAERMAVRMSGPSELDLALPPYGGRRHMYLGRAVTDAPAQFSVEEVK